MIENYKHTDITEKIIRAYYNVYNKMGFGFLEKVYERAMVIELKKMNLNCEDQYLINVFYDGENIGDYYADIIVENKVIVELKAVSKLSSNHEVQLVNYLKATEIEVGLLLNFGEKPQYKRKVFSAEFKKS